MGQGFCPRCNQTVMTKQNIDVCGIIIGFILGVIPGIICLIIQLTKPQDTCVICGGKVLPPAPQNHGNQQSLQALPPQQNAAAVRSVPPSYVQVPSKPVASSSSSNTMMPPLQADPQFCPLCGEKVEKIQKFCSRCGGELTK